MFSGSHWQQMNLKKMAKQTAHSEKVVRSFLIAVDHYLTLLCLSSLILCSLSALSDSTMLHSVYAFIKWRSRSRRGTGHKPRSAWTCTLSKKMMFGGRHLRACDHTNNGMCVTKAAGRAQWRNGPACVKLSPSIPGGGHFFFFFFFLMWLFYPAREALTRCHERTHAAPALKGTPCHIAAPGPHIFFF